MRRADLSDIPAVAALIPLSVRELSRGFYTEREVESALRFVFGPDSQLVRDGTYFVVESEGELVGCGGWSRRRKLYGGDQTKRGVEPLLDPRVDAARIRAFYVTPGWARRGIGARLLEASISAAAEAGFRRLELLATLPGVPLYRRHGFIEEEHVIDRLPDGVELSFVRMSRGVLLH